MRTLCALALLCAGSPLWGASQAGAEVLHVAHGAPAGDGSAERPFGRVAQALARAQPGDSIQIETGLYEEALTLERPVRLAGVGQVVLAAPPGSPVAVLSRADASLVHLTVQGGRVGVRAEAGALRLEAVALRGQPDAAVACASGARCALQGVELQASFASASGVRAQGRVELRDLTVTGPFKRGLDVPGGELVGRQVAVRGAATGLSSEGGRIELRDLEVAGARVACAALRGGQARLREAVLSGAEYGLLLSEKVHLALEGAVVAGAQQAGIGGTEAEIEAHDLVVLGPSSDAAIGVSGGSLKLADALVRDPGPIGVRARLAQVELRRLTALDPRLEEEDFGNALHLDDSTLDATDVVAARCPGPAVEVLRGQGTLRSLLVERAGLAGLAYEYQSHLDAPGLLVTSGLGAGVACVESGRGRLLAPRLERLATPWLVDCSCHLAVKPAKSGPEGCGKVGDVGGVDLPARQSGRARGP